MSFKNILSFFLLAAFSLFKMTTQAEMPKEQSYQFTIQKQIYPLATFFSIHSEDIYRGVVKKSAFRLRTNYDLSNVDGWQASGIKRVLSLGSVYSWATEIDIYDTNWNTIGMIDGQAATTAAARFSIYDKNGNLTAIAYLDHSLDHYVLAAPGSEMFPMARLDKEIQTLESDRWIVTVYESNQIDERILRIFAAMACDMQESIGNYYDE